MTLDYPLAMTGGGKALPFKVEERVSAEGIEYENRHRDSLDAGAAATCHRAGIEELEVVTFPSSATARSPTPAWLDPDPDRA